MGKTKRAPYETQIKELEEDGGTKFIKEHSIYAVLVTTKVPIQWKKDGREYQEDDTLNPGMVLYPRPRKLSKWEKELSKEEQRALGINLEWNQVRIVYRFPDLWGAIRQRGRHIVDKLMGRRVIINKEVEIIIAGEAKQMKDLASIINSFTNRFLAVERFTSKIREDFSQELFPIYQELEGVKNVFKAKAAKLLEQAMEGRGIEITARLAEANAKILNRWIEIIDIIENSLKQAENWLLLCKGIEMKIGWAYKRLAELGEEIQGISGLGKTVQVERVSEITDELGGILTYLNREILFNPYYQRVSAPGVQNLAKAKKYLQAQKYKSIGNLISQALAKLQAIVLKEKPSIAEVRRRRRALPRG